MDVVTLGMAKAAALKSLGKRTLPGQFPAPVCAGRVYRPTLASALTGYTFQRAYKMYNDAAQVRLVYINTVMQGGNQENSYGPVTIKASVIWDYNPSTLAGTLVPVTFNGATSATMGTYQVLVSDPIDVSFATTKDSYFVVRTYATGTGSYLPVAGGEPFNPNGIPEGYLTGDSTGTITSFSGPANDLNFGPQLVVGWPTSNRNNTTLLTGDSIMAGTGFLTGTVAPAPGAGSFASYALDTAGVPAISVPRSGETVSVIVQYWTARYRMALAHGCKYAISNYGTNDIGNNRTLAQIKTDLLNHWAYLARRGVASYHCTILPRNTTSNGWQTVAGQGLYAGAGQEGIRQSLNQWLRAPASAGAGNSALADSAGALLGVFDTAAKLEVNADGSAITLNAATGAVSNGAGGYTKTDTTTYASGTVSSIPSSTKLSDTTKAWTLGQWQGYSVVIDSDTTTPAAVGQCLQIATNAATQLNLNAAWTTTPSTSATYRIVKVYTTDGIHPSTPGHQLMATAIDTARLT